MKMASARMMRACLFFVTLASNAYAGITDYYAADVTQNSFTVVFASDTPLAAPGIRVFSDSGGTTQLSPDVQVLSTAQQHSNGLAVLRLRSLNTNTTYYFDITEDTGAPVWYPSAPIPSVATMPLAPAAAGTPLVTNDLVKLDIYRPDQITSLQDAVVLMTNAAVSPWPVTAPVQVNEFAYIDMNNLLAADGSAHAMTEGDNIELKVMRGLLCAGAVDQLQIFYRKQAADPDAGTQVGMADNCNAADTVCDDSINVLDIQFVLNSLNATPAECRFTAELDVVGDDAINVLDVQQILNNF